MSQPEGYSDGTDCLCHLIKSLYGLKQAGREWNAELNKELEAHNWNPSVVDPCLYIRKTSKGIEIIAIWVDDLLLFASSLALMERMKRDLQSLFEITDLGEPSKIVGIEIHRDYKHKTITISQRQYIKSILAKEGLLDCNSVGMPMNPNEKLIPSEGETGEDGYAHSYASLIGSLMYLAVATRPDIAYAVYHLGSFMANPSMAHWSAAKRVLRYLSGTRDYGITYRADKPSPEENHFLGYSDASYANNDDVTSVSGYVFLMSGGAITWDSRKQNNVSLSTTESEYVALAEATRELTWLRNLLQGLGFDQLKPTVLYGDNSGALAIAKDPQYHKRTKHFDTRHHYIHQKLQSQEVEIFYCPTSIMTADIFTKALPKPKHQLHVAELGMSPN